MKLKNLIIIILVGFSFGINAQSESFVYGKVTNEKGKALTYAHVFDTLTQKNTFTDKEGNYKLILASDKNFVLGYSYLGYEILYKTIRLQKGETLNVDVQLKPKANIIEGAVVKDKGNRASSTERMDAKSLEFISAVEAGVEKIIMSKGLGANSTNELSAQYSVRGGNFDENLVYVNDFEIYRPFLIRSGQQEGLSFINPNLVGQIAFSSGGFQAKYGDKMSSVLNIKYKRPSEFKGSFSLGLLGYSTHLEGISKNEKLTFLVGLRYKSNAYLLNALPTEGQYKPSFLDVQTYVTYNISNKLQLAWLSNVSRNRYELIPESAEVKFGTVENAAQVEFEFEGQERDKFLSNTNGLSLRYQPNDQFSAKLLTSVYVTDEKEAFDILANYTIQQLESDPGSKEYGNPKNPFGAGSSHEYARNRLNAIISNTELKLAYAVNNHFIQGGLQYKYEDIADDIKEWDRVDSAGYSLPISSEEVLLSRYLKVNQHLKSSRYAAYLQDTYTAGADDRFKATVGLRANYWSVNKELYFNPRLQISLNPKGLYIFDRLVEKDIVLKASTGLHYQPPFYRELRNNEGQLNLDVRAQKSWHTVIGADYNFQLGNKPFSFVAQAYYKKLWDLVPYDIDNVLIRYYGKNAAEGYAMGIDFRIGGQFVGETESWFSFSLLKTEENVYGDYYYKSYFDKELDEHIISDTLVGVGFIPRPTDQRFNFNIFFQDHLPNNENYKAHLNFVWGGGFAYGPPDNAKHRNQLRYPSYKRADVGFSAILFDTEKTALPTHNPFRHFKSLWITGEILNILGFGNTISSSWVKDFDGVQYALPKRSTSRLANVRLVAKF